MVALTMMALALSEDSIRLRAQRNSVIDALGVLPDQIREVGSSASVVCPLWCWCYRVLCSAACSMRALLPHMMQWAYVLADRK